MHTLNDLTDKILRGYEITRDESLALFDEPLDALKQAATTITKHFFDNKIELCSITNGKCGRCSEDCKFCSQSKRFKTEITSSPLKTIDEMFEEAKAMANQGVHRFSVVTAGSKLSKAEIRTVAEAFKKIKKELGIECCGSLGLLDYDDFMVLKEAGMTRTHNNIETSPAFFPKICTTHKFEHKLKTLEAAKRAGLEICSGCIIGMGESIEDRADIALELRRIGVDSVPINVLNPIKGTPLENQPPLDPNDIKRTAAVFRLTLPKAVLRLAGGRLLIKDFYTDLYNYGINALITGDMLTTAGLSVAGDISDIIRTSHRLAEISPLNASKQAS